MKIVRSKLLAMGMAFSLILFTGTWTRALLNAAPQHASAAGSQNSDEGQCGQQGEFEGEHEDTQCGANDEDNKAGETDSGEGQNHEDDQTTGSDQGQ